ncbi:ABC transporter substrate-binding protein [Marinobacter sp. ANT_B65]|uniref:ABC transporter substrate-binding protein n=1 Tax=Marinobacter sp. ANT_B65 TaxID=2039467 RepID=UPI001D0D4661|nr:hypothetical protein [Marinobacter sp. ANT_B65]
MTENTVLFWKLATARIHQALHMLIVAAILVGTSPAQARDTDHLPVYLAGSGNVTLDKHIQNLLKQNLGSQRDLILVSDKQAATIKNEPIVTIGPGAFSRIRQVNRKAAVLAMLTGQDFLNGFANRSSGRISGVYYDVPLLRQALIGKAILPQATRIALLATTSSAELYDLLIDQLPQYGLEARLFIVKDDKQLIPTLIRALSYGDFLLAAPDSAIYNPRTIKHILLTAYRRNRIVIGPSQAYVKAGALASGYAPFPAMTEMAADYLHEFFETGQFPGPDYPADFKVEINQQVARSLNIPLGSKEQIVKSVQSLIENKGGQGDE